MVRKRRSSHLHSGPAMPAINSSVSSTVEDHVARVAIAAGFVWQGLLVLLTLLPADFDQRNSDRSRWLDARLDSKRAPLRITTVYSPWPSGSMRAIRSIDTIVDR